MYILRLKKAIRATFSHHITGPRDSFLPVTTLAYPHFTSYQIDMAFQSANETKFSRFTNSGGDTFNCFSDGTKGTASNNAGTVYVRRIAPHGKNWEQRLSVETDGKGMCCFEISGLQETKLTNVNEVGRALRRLQEIAATGQSDTLVDNMTDPVDLVTVVPSSRGTQLRVQDFEQLSRQLGTAGPTEKPPAYEL